MRRQPAPLPSAPAAVPVPPPAYFLSLAVENYRCFGPAQTLDLSNGKGRPASWTIILGENGVGKTTLLQCLAAMQPSPMRPEEISDDDRAISQDHFLPIGANSHTFINLWNDSVRHRVFGQAGIIKSTFGYGHSLTSSQITYATAQLYIRGFIGSRTIENSFLDIGGLVCYGYGASRRMGKSNLSEQRTEDTTASLFSDDVDLINAEEWLLQADYAASKSQGSSKAAHHRDEVKQVLINLLPDVSDLRIDMPEGSFGAPSVEFQTPYGWVPLKGLNLGYRTLITWMVDLASRLFDRYPNSENPLAEPAVVLVDEIDLHLHPRWQRTLMQFLSARFPNAQFIATAHSPLVVQAAGEDANIVLLRREGDHVVIDNDVEAIRNWRVDQILTSGLFGLDSARPPQTEGLLNEREALLSKPRLTKRDQARLQEIETLIGTLPTGETPQDREAMDIIRQAAALIQAK